jgi:hypothetical protein
MARPQPSVAAACLPKLQRRRQQRVSPETPRRLPQSLQVEIGAPAARDSEGRGRPVGTGEGVNAGDNHSEALAPAPDFAKASLSAFVVAMRGDVMPITRSTAMPSCISLDYCHRPLGMPAEASAQAGERVIAEGGRVRVSTPVIITAKRQTPAFSGLSDDVTD